VDASVIAVVAPPTILGALLGARMTGLYRKEFLSRLVGWSVSGIGLFMVVQAVWGFASKA
jgi:uncharacterized membrane protein YfcA